MLVTVLFVLAAVGTAPVASLGMPGSAYSVTVAGNRASDAAASGGLRIIDITNPAAPAQTGNVAVGGTVENVVVKDFITYVAAQATGLVVVNVADPANPMVITSPDTAGSAMGVAVMDEFIADDFGRRAAAVAATGEMGAKLRRRTFRCEA